LPQYVRNHWGIENKLHWILDVQMHEDNDQKTEVLLCLKESPQILCEPRTAHPKEMSAEN